MVSNTVLWGECSKNEDDEMAVWNKARVEDNGLDESNYDAYYRVRPFFFAGFDRIKMYAALLIPLQKIFYLVASSYHLVATR